MEKVCPICGKTNKINNKFCITCGVKLGEAEPNQKQIIMSEKTEQEKWEQYEWYIFNYDTFINLGGGVLRKVARAKALAYGKIIFDDDKFSIGDFSLKYINIIRFEKPKKVYIKIYDVDGKIYKFATKKSIKESRDTVFLILSEKLKQYEGIKKSEAIEIIKNLPQLYREINLDDVAAKTALDRVDVINIIEQLIIDGEFNAEIRGSVLKLKKEPEKREGMLIKAKKTLDLGHDVFICHSSKDKEIADATCHFLEQNGIKCWIAPRDVSTGSYAVSIVDAIETSKLLVIIFSNNSNVSDHVKNELEIAVSSGITIQPFRIEDVEPSTEMKYYIKRMHWLDALTPPLEDHLSKLTEMISKLLEVVSN